ncbi:MAG: tRNA dihydrouridine synthase DusB [Thermodesulfobacteriota bacterium]
MRIGPLQLSSPLILAPMSGITDYPFRQMVRYVGGHLTFTEMVSAEGLLRKGDSFLKIRGDEHPLFVQLFGSSAEVLAEAASMVESFGADGVDINMGCPAPQVVKVGAGADLMRFPEKVKRILIEVRKRVRIPLTIKIRSGWDQGHINACEISKIAEDCGLNAISIHPRTKCQGFKGKADWDLIGKMKQSTSIPVIGNGDAKTPLLAERMMKETGCDGVMIGRGALGNPWVFHPDKKSSSQIALKEKERIIHHHFSLLQEEYGEQRAMKRIRRHLYWYTKSLPYCTSLHSQLSGIKEKERMFEIIHSYFESIESGNPYSSSREWVSSPLLNARGNQ